QTPRAMPASVGRTIDHPTTPYSPSANQVAPCVRARARNRRVSLRPIRALRRRSAPSSSVTPALLHLEESLNEVHLQARQRASRRPFMFVADAELLVDGVAQLAEGR